MTTAAHDKKTTEEDLAASLTGAEVVRLVQGAGNVKAPLSLLVAPPPSVTHGVAAYTAQLADAPFSSSKAGIIGMDWPTANAVTIPSDSVANFDIGTQLLIVQVGAGQTAIQADGLAGGVQVHSAASLTCRVRYSGLLAVKMAANLWFVFGDMT